MIKLNSYRSFLSANSSERSTKRKTGKQMQTKVDFEAALREIRDTQKTTIIAGRLGWLPKETPPEAKFNLALLLLVFTKKNHMDLAQAMDFVETFHYQLLQREKWFTTRPIEEQYTLAVKTAQYALSHHREE